jgi:hypothetical protein
MHGPNAKGQKDSNTGCKPTNPHLIENLDPIKDAPIDILHTLYLGTAKHYMKDFIGTLSTEAKKTFTKFINENTTLKGIKQNNIGNISNIYNSFQAKEMRIVVSVLPFSCLAVQQYFVDNANEFKLFWETSILLSELGIFNLKRSYHFTKCSVTRELSSSDRIVTGINENPNRPFCYRQYKKQNTFVVTH